MESTPANFRTTRPLWSQYSSSCNSRREPSGASAESCFRSANRSGKSVCKSAATSPRRPCARTTRATVMNAWFAMPLPLEFLRAGPCLLQDFQRVTLFQLHAGGAQDGADGARRPALFADDLAKIVRRDPQLEDRALFAFECVH